MPDNKSLCSPPLVSVLVPVYNVQAYLEECLDSLCRQTFTDFEVICINDGSTDDSRDIILKFCEKDARFRIIDKTNSGYGASMNCGLDAATGSYIAILESDDFCAPEALKRLVKTIEDFDAQVVKANCYFYWSGPPAKKRRKDLVPHTQTGRLVNPRVDREIFSLTPSVWSALYRRDFLADKNIRFNETPGAAYQDSSFNFKVWASAIRVVFLKEAFVHYRQDNAASSVNSPAKVYCVCDEYEEMDRFLSTQTEVPDWLLCLKAKMKYDTYIWNYERLADEFQLEFLQRMSAELNAEQALGHLDWQLFEEWKVLDLKSILRSPEDYHQQRQKSGIRTKPGKALHYLRLGGISLLAKVVRSKLFHRY